MMIRLPELCALRAACLGNAGHVLCRAVGSFAIGNNISRSLRHWRDDLADADAATAQARIANARHARPLRARGPLACRALPL
jgi:hypothetical protein